MDPGVRPAKPCGIGIDTWRVEESATAVPERSGVAVLSSVLYTRYWSVLFTLLPSTAEASGGSFMSRLVADDGICTGGLLA
jgi:hypothetical protein